MDEDDFYGGEESLGMATEADAEAEYRRNSGGLSLFGVEYDPE